MHPPGQTCERGGSASVETGWLHSGWLFEKLTGGINVQDNVHQAGCKAHDGLSRRLCWLCAGRTMGAPDTPVWSEHTPIRTQPARLALPA